MGLSENRAVNLAYSKGNYTDADGRQWRRGMDGWFLENTVNQIVLIRHHDFVSKVEGEHPDDQ